MNILIYEYFLGQDKNINLSPEVLHEAKLIINSLIIDITGLHDKPKISLFISKKNRYLFNSHDINFIDTSSQDLYNLIDNDFNYNEIYILAPEENLILHDIIKNLEIKNLNTCNCSSKFIKLTSNKYKINSVLKKSKDYTIETYSNSRELLKDKKIIAKIVDGCGAENLYVFDNLIDMKNYKSKLTKNHIYQYYYDGNIIGINIIANKNKYKIISINEQIYEKFNNNELVLKKIEIGKFNHMIDEFTKFVENILQNFDGYYGFFGIDAILTSDKKIIFLEINPRLTTSYIGLSKSIGFNVMQLYYDLACKHDIINNKKFSINI
jgi:predicted ATP-grasp superfamily ATP-dependent carboligase